jgi:polysaccharide biosynthesis/export protein
MRLAIRSAVFVLLAISGFGQDSKPQSAPPKQTGTPPAVMSPKATIPSPAAEGTKPAVETDPSKMAAPPGSGKDPGALSEKTYIIGAEDVLQIIVWADKNLSGLYHVRPDGRISMSLAGEFRASERTPEQLASDIGDRLKAMDILRNPQVTVSVSEVRSKSIYIIGEVNKPGKYALIVPTTVLQALVNAGGFKDFANQKSIIIQRGTERLKFNYKEVIQGKHTEQNILLQPEDHIIVK